jgi:glucoamylase
VIRQLPVPAWRTSLAVLATAVLIVVTGSRPGPPGHPRPGTEGRAAPSARGPLLRSMATGALLGLETATQPNGAVIAGPRPMWRYSWPRDSSWVAVAFADTGHPGDALRILRFLQETQLPAGTWAARYWPDGSGPVHDGRPAELDAVGWVPWAVWCWFASSKPAGPAALAQLAQFWPMVSAAADAAVRSLSPAGLPAASADYWEHGVQVTLGTAAPLLVGLRASAAIAGALGHREMTRAWSAAAARLETAVDAAFGCYGYHRLSYDASGPDVSVTFLGPPFEPASAAVDQAARDAQTALTLPGGGVLPGTDWPGNTTIAWTPETALFALFDASAGRHQQAASLLVWLADHRTRGGALPEQVNAQGRPVSVAPLAWTDAAVLLALTAQERTLPAIPGGTEPGDAPRPGILCVVPVVGR